MRVPVLPVGRKVEREVKIEPDIFGEDRLETKCLASSTEGAAVQRISAPGEPRCAGDLHEFARFS